MSSTVLYIAPTVVDILKYTADGICKKIHQQLSVFSEYCDVYLIGYSDNDVIVYHNQTKYREIKNSSNKHRRLFLYDCVNNLSNELVFNTIYIRYAKSDYLFVKLLKRLHKVSSKIIIEIPTYPYKNEMKDNMHDRLMLFSDTVFSRFLKKYVKYIATFSHDDYIFGIPCLNISNGVIVDDYHIRKPIENNNQIHLVSVSTMRKAHGYDRVLTGLGEYYKSNSDHSINILFELVGDGPCLEQYKEIVKSYGIENNVIFSGFLSGNELQNSYDKADIAVGVLGLHRFGLSNASPIKTREYLAVGLPIISAGSLNLLNDESFILYVPENDEPINIDSVISFYNEIYKNANHQIIANEIHEFAKKTCDLKVSMKTVIDNL